MTTFEAVMAWLWAGFIVFIIVVAIIGSRAGEGLKTSCEVKGGVYINDLCLRKDAVIE